MLQHDAIHNLDCLKGLNQLDRGSVDLVFADPPFNIGYDYDVYEDRKAADDYLAWSRKWIGGVVDALKDDGTFWLAIGDEYAAELKVIMQSEFQLTCRSWVIWYYTFGVNCTNKFSRSHAHLFHMVKDPKQFTFNADQIRVPSARQLVYGDKRAESAWSVAPTILGSCGRRTCLTDFSPTTTRGTFLGWLARSKSELVGMAAKCLNNS